MSPFSLKRLVTGVTLAVASTAASGGAAQALLNHGANFSIAIPVTAVAPIGVCSSQSVGTSNNANHGEEFDHNDARSSSDSESDCKVANHVVENVHDVLNDNNSHNLNENFSNALNHALHHNNNDNLQDIGERGALLEL